MESSMNDVEQTGSLGQIENVQGENQQITEKTLIMDNQYNREPINDMQQEVLEQIPRKSGKGKAARRRRAIRRRRARQRIRRKKETVIKVRKVGMKFNLSSEKVDNLKEYVIKWIRHEIHYQEFWALKDVTFQVKKGDRVGIIGLNGAGKSTLLKVVAGVLKPTEGAVEVNGKIVPLLELGAGFDKQYTGKENIFLYGAMLGYPKEFIKQNYDAIVEFSELGEFIDVPVKNYSSGMKARLGFSIATIIKPEILILDEVLSVGDARFRRKSERRIKKMFKQGVTVLFVSHSLEQVKRICNRAILLENGRVVSKGPVAKVAKVYQSKINSK